jgi:dolichol-phosphate mannosyltransferase
MKAMIVMPTYNETGNLELVIGMIRAQPGVFHVLIVDDNSPDGTGKLGDSLAKQYPGEVFVLHRERKEGLGRAYLAGYLEALRHPGYDAIFQMDADLSHPADQLPQFLAALQHFDLVQGSRYMDGGGVSNWDGKRQFLSRTASKYVRMVTGLPVADATSGFKCWRRSALEKMALDKVSARGYVFNVEVTYRAYCRKLSIGEIPITFCERNLGRSKISPGVIFEAFWRVAWLRFKRLGR